MTDAERSNKIAEAIHKLVLTDWEARQLFFFALGVMRAMGMVRQLNLIYEEAKLWVEKRRE